MLIHRYALVKILPICGSSLLELLKYGRIGASTKKMPLGKLLRDPMRGDPSDAHRIRKLHAPAYGLRDAPAAFRRSFQKYLLSSVVSSANVRFRFRQSSFAPCLHFVFRKEGGAVGASGRHIDDIPGCGGPDAPTKIHVFWEIALER